MSIRKKYRPPEPEDGMTADGGNRTPNSSLGSWRFTTKLHPRDAYYSTFSRSCQAFLMENGRYPQIFRRNPETFREGFPGGFSGILLTLCTFCAIISRDCEGVASAFPAQQVNILTVIGLACFNLRDSWKAAEAVHGVFFSSDTGCGLPYLGFLFSEEHQ